MTDYKMIYQNAIDNGATEREALGIMEAETMRSIVHSKKKKGKPLPVDIDQGEKNQSCHVCLQPITKKRFDFFGRCCCSNQCLYEKYY